MIPFLQSVAEAYKSHYSDLSDFTFVFPNKRSGTFFLKYLSSISPSPIIAPEIFSISDFIIELSGRIPDSKINLIFRLFNCYKKLLGPGENIDFDKFRSWGEIVLSDFDEIDMQLVEPAEIFKNVKDFKEISTNFLTDEQYKVMEEYFGYKNSRDVSPSFWKDFEKTDEDSPRGKFFYIWQILYPLYNALESDLASQGLTTTGGAYRLAFQHVNDIYNGFRNGESIPLQSPLRHKKKLVFIGFNALSRAEFRIFGLLHKMTVSIQGVKEPFADFLWDATGPFLSDPDNPAAHFINLDRQFLPSPEWCESFIEKSDTDSLPEVINVISVPSNSAQIKVIGSQLDILLDKIASGQLLKIEGNEKLKKSLEEEVKRLHPELLNTEEIKKAKLKIALNRYLNRAKVAIILPDENLLQPLLYSLPEKVENLNLTMGYPLRQTAVVSFITLFRRMQMRRTKTSSGEPGFLMNDIRSLLAHPYMQQIFGSISINKFLSVLADEHHFAIPSSRFNALGTEAEVIFSPFNPKAKPTETVGLLINILRLIEGGIQEDKVSFINGKMERTHIGRYLDALNILKDSFTAFDIDMHFSSVFMLADRLISSETVSFEGEPLAGLQIMGMLETRSLDFDYLFIPSVNDKILPRKARSRTFIPNSLRHVYGMPPANYQENIFAYYFFRLLSRAKCAWMTYDSRTGDGSSGGISRYLLQIKHLIAPEEISFREGTFDLAVSRYHNEEVNKTGYIKNELNLYLREGIIDDIKPRKFSASSLATYISCPMRFFFEQILCIKTEEESSESIDAITTGNIIHRAMMELYLPEEQQKIFLPEPILISREKINSLLNDKEYLKKLLIRTVNAEHFKLPDDKLDRPLQGSAAFTLPGLLKMVENILLYDLKQAPFLIYGCEMKGDFRIPLSTGDIVNMTCSIDRIDRDASDPSAPLRIVDYKTGHVSLECDSIDDIFSPDGSGKNIFQLYLYAFLLSVLINERYPQLAEQLPDYMEVEIYNVLKILDNNPKILKHPMIGKMDAKDTSIHKTGFLQHLDETISELLNSDIPFKRTPNEDNCSFCSLKNICYR